MWVAFLRSLKKTTFFLIYLYQYSLLRTSIISRLINSYLNNDVYVLCCSVLKIFIVNTSFILELVLFG